jgi:type I restriction enzyme S subunit
LKWFRTLRFPLAPLQEQQRIADSLDSFLSRLDAAVASLERTQAKLKAYRASVLKAAVEGRLVPTEAALARAENRAYEPADVLLKRILADRRRRWEESELARLKAAGKRPNDDKWRVYAEPASPEIRASDTLPEGWCWATLDQLLASLSGGTSATAIDTRTSNVVLRSSAVRQGRVDLSDHRFLPAEGPHGDYLIEEGDLLFTRLSGTLDYVGNCAVAPPLAGKRIAFPDRIFRGRCVGELVPEYVQHCFGVSSLRGALERAAKSTAGHQRISLADLRTFRIPLPPYAEQSRIAEAVALLLSVAEATSAAADLIHLRTGRLRQSTLKSAFEGKLVDPDPSDEPTAQLLDRIREERAAATTSRKSRVKRKTAATK